MHLSVSTSIQLFLMYHRVITSDRPVEVVVHNERYNGNSQTELMASSTNGNGDDVLVCGWGGNEKRSEKRKAVHLHQPPRRFRLHRRLSD